MGRWCSKVSVGSDAHAPLFSESGARKLAVAPWFEKRGARPSPPSNRCAGRLPQRGTRRAHRDLPWRRTSDAWRIWGLRGSCSSRTRVETVGPVLRALRRPASRNCAGTRAGPTSPTVLALVVGARVLPARPRNAPCGGGSTSFATTTGRFPPRTSSARRRDLPGIGPLDRGRDRSSISYGVRGSRARRQRESAVLTRPLRGCTGIPTQKPLENEAFGSSRPPSSINPDPGDVNQVLMELGATVCLAVVGGTMRRIAP